MTDELDKKDELVSFTIGKIIKSDYSKARGVRTIPKGRVNGIKHEIRRPSRVKDTSKS